MPQVRLCRSLAVNVARGLVKCFKAGCDVSGSIIDLVAAADGIHTSAAADKIGWQFGIAVAAPKKTEDGRREGFDPERYAATLDASHEDLASFGISPETLQEWRAGYTGKGILAGCLAIPWQDCGGNVLAYFGVSVKDGELRWPKSFSPQGRLFGTHRVTSGALQVVRDPLTVLKNSEMGFENVVATLDPLSPEMLETIAGFAQSKGCTEILL